jgi:hypothetical protein
VVRADLYIWEYQVVPTPRFTSQFAAKLEVDLAGFLGPGMQVDVQTVDRIAVEASGKRLIVKSQLTP